jgi:hypothetical protein
VIPVLLAALVSGEVGVIEETDVRFVVERHLDDIVLSNLDIVMQVVHRSPPL